MGLKILKFGDTEVLVSVSEKTLESLLDAGVCEKRKITQGFVLKQLKKGVVLMPHDNGLRSQKIKELKDGTEYVRINDNTVPLATISDICHYVKTGKERGAVINVNTGNSTMATFTKAFGAIEPGATFFTESDYGDDVIDTQYGRFNVKKLLAEEFITKSKEPQYEGEFEYGKTQYYRGQQTRVRSNDGVVFVGCKTYSKKMLLRLGRALDTYLKEKADLD